MGPPKDNEYTYAPLVKYYCQPIRLLKILPGFSSTAICCELFSTYIKPSDDPQTPPSYLETLRSQLGRSERNISYTALSYVWGDAKDRVIIRVNGKDLWITRNLWIFLDRHRRTFSSRLKTREFFWIDAICIDQGNVEERSKQVAFMADIYRKAKMVLVWLGEGDLESHKTFNTIKLRGMNLPWPEGECLADTPIFQTGYWDRLWIIQEIFHARRITVRCGTLEVDWELLIKALHGETEPPCLEVQKFRKSSGGHLGYDVLCQFGRKASSDPRDAVYALRSLAPSLMKLVPDYSLSTIDVFTTATRAIITSPPSLVFLDNLMLEQPWGARISRLEGFPSWVPDWRMNYRFFSTIYPSFPSYSGGGHPVGYKWEQWEQWQLLAHPNPRILLLKGIPVDFVIHTTELWQGPDPRTLRQTKKQLQNWLPGCETSLRKLWDLDHERVTSSGLLEEFARQRGFNISIPASERKFSSDEWGWLSALTGNALVITKSGYRGFVSGKPKVNDLIFVAYRAEYPYILRKVGGSESESFSLIGKAMIEGLMAGEALGLHMQGKLSERNILLV